jgi:hypothetical protein
MMEAGIKTLDEVKKKDDDAHVDPISNMNKSTNPSILTTTSNNAAVDVDNAAAAKEMISKLLEGGTAFKGEMSLMMNDDHE